MTRRLRESAVGGTIPPMTGSKTTGRARRLVRATMAGLAALACVPASAATFGLSTDGSTAYLRGRIEIGDASRFDLLVESAKPRMLELDSPGGNLVAGVAIGMKARERRMKTLVRNGSTCASACGIIWVSANERYLDDKARVGFHSAAESGKSARVDIANDGVAKYLFSLGMRTEFVVFALQSDPRGISWLGHDNAARLGVAIADPDTLYDKAMLTARAARGGAKGPEVVKVTAFERELPSLVEVKDGRALVNVDGLEVWVRRGSRLPGGVSVAEVAPATVLLRWDGGERRLSVPR